MPDEPKETMKSAPIIAAGGEAKPLPPLPGKKVFRLALYGVRGSGKTCILAALTLPRAVNPKGFTCTWIEEVAGHEFPKGSPSTWVTSDPFHIGWKWLHAQRAHLKSGDLPEPNKASQETMRFVFDFGSKEHGRQQIELIDYSGELLTATASELAKNLREIMRECDGLLILAEVPFPGRDQTSDAENLEKLKGAFLKILDERAAGAKADWPIALLFNKWDRRLDFASMPTDSGQGEIKAFLAETPQPAQAPLANMIANVVGEENMRCFPVSAFGASQIRPDGMEAPRNQGVLLNSFNLEDGFIWVAQHSDQLLLKKLSETFKNTPWWTFWQLFIGAQADVPEAKSSPMKHWGRGVSAFKGIAASFHFMRRISLSNALYPQAKNVLKQFAIKAAVQFLVFIFSLMAIEAIIDGSNNREVQVTLENPAATKDQVNSAEVWLQGYAVSPKYRHMLSTILVLNRTEASNQLGKFRKKHDEIAWKSVEEVKDHLVKIQVAKKYLEDFPNGAHRSKAQELVDEDAVRIKVLANQDHLESIGRKISAINGQSSDGNSLSAAREKLDDLFEAIAKLPHPETNTDTISTKQKDLRASWRKMSEEINQRTLKLSWEEFKKTYRGLMDRRNVADAADALANREPKDKNLNDLEADFVERAPAIIKDKKVEAIKRRGWKEARGCLELATHPSVVKLLPADQLKEISGWKYEIDELEDQDLYGQILKFQPQCSDQVDAYLKSAPLKKMQPQVVGYKEYLKLMGGKMDLTLNLASIRWDTNYYSGTRTYNFYNNIDVKVQGASRISKSGVVSKPGEVFGGAGGCPINLNPNDTVVIDVVNTGSYGILFTSNFDGGKGIWRGSVAELSRGATIELKGDGFSNTATFTIDGFPSAPDLPAWMK